MIEDLPVDAAVLPLVSIIIPAYNHERFVERCLDSVLEDPYPEKEIVIIDDGSTDRTAQIVLDWIAEHADDIHVEFVSRENQGIAATLNELAARARGKFLRLGASDDYLLPGGIEAQVRYLLAHPSKWAVIGDAIVVDRDGRRLHDSSICGLHHADKRLYRSDEGLRRAVISHWAVGGPVAMIRKTSLQTVAGWSEYLCIDDWDFFLRLAAHDAIGFIDVRVCAYRIHDSNTSKTRDRRRRVLNLIESRGIALRRTELFDEPHRTLLFAQSHYIAAKIAFLQRKPGVLALHMLVYLALWLVTKSRRRYRTRVVGGA